MTIDEKIKVLETDLAALRKQRDNWLPGWDTTEDDFGPLVFRGAGGSQVCRMECDDLSIGRTVLLRAEDHSVEVLLHDLGLFVDRARAFTLKNS